MVCLCRRCETGCVTKRCGCVQQNKRCSLRCSCRGCRNGGSDGSDGSGSVAAAVDPLDLECPSCLDTFVNPVTTAVRSDCGKQGPSLCL